MTTPNARSDSVEVESGPLDANNPAHEEDRPGKAGRPNKSDWLNYSLIAAGVVTTLGVIILLWGSTQNSSVIMLLGASLLVAGTLGWMGIFIFLTWSLIRDFGPLIWRRLNGVHKFFPKFNANGD